MALLPRKAVLAVAAVIDVALNGRSRPVSAKALAARHGLPPRHLEPILQALVREGILRGIRGPRGGYKIARDQHRVSADDILRAAGTTEDSVAETVPASAMLSQVVLPALAGAEKEFASALSRISLEDMARKAERFLNRNGDNGTADALA
jgi:Rrf2 family protein